jgi:hypothetical protein
MNNIENAWCYDSLQNDISHVVNESLNDTIQPNFIYIMQCNVCMHNNESYIYYIINFSKNNLLTTNTNNNNIYTSNNINNNQIYPKHNLNPSINNNFKIFHNIHNNKTL